MLARMRRKTRSRKGVEDKRMSLMKRKGSRRLCRTRQKSIVVLRVTAMQRTERVSKEEYRNVQRKKKSHLGSWVNMVVQAVVTRELSQKLKKG